MGIDVAGASTQMSARHMERSLEAALSSTRRSLKRTLPLDRAATASSAVSWLHAAGYRQFSRERVPPAKVSFGRA